MYEAAWSQEVLELVRHPDDRRLVARLLDYWMDLCGDRRIPPLQSFDVSEIKEFRSNCFVLAIEDPVYKSRFRYVGDALREDAGIDLTNASIDGAPEGALISQLTAEFGEVIRKQRPVGFEGQFVTKDGANAAYRGVLLPFGSDASRIENVVGAISSTQKLTKPTAGEPASGALRKSENSRLQEMQEVLHPEILPVALDQGLRDVLEDCRSLAADVETARTKAREKLYETLAKVYELHALSEENSSEYDELLIENGLTKQDRAPFTPLVKLVFGVSYDRSRVSEYAAALAYAKRMGQEFAQIKDFLSAQEGGIKGCAIAERAAKADGRTKASDRLEKTKQTLRDYSVLGAVPDSGSGNDEFVLMIGRRSAESGGQIDVLSVLDEPEKVVAPILRRAVRGIRKLEKP